MGKKIKKIAFAGIGDDVFGTDLQGKKQDAALREAEETRRQEEQQARLMRDLQQNIQDNLARDLKGENMATVVAGGSADAVNVSTEPTKKRRAGGLTAALGGF